MKIGKTIFVWGLFFSSLIARAEPVIYKGGVCINLSFSANTQFREQFEKMRVEMAARKEFLGYLLEKGKSNSEKFVFIFCANSKKRFENFFHSKLFKKFQTIAKDHSPEVDKKIWVNLDRDFELRSGSYYLFTHIFPRNGIGLSYFVKSKMNSTKINEGIAGKILETNINSAGFVFLDSYGAAADQDMNEEKFESRAKEMIRFKYFLKGYFLSGR